MPLRDIFKKDASQRFIDIHGRPWVKNSPFDHLTPEMVMGLAIIGANTAAGIAHGYDPVTIGLFSAKSALQSVLVAEFMSVTARIPLMRLSEKFTHYAIDREGRAIPPQNNPALMDQVRTYGKTNTMVAMQIGAMMAVSSFVFKGTMMDIPHGIAQTLSSLAQLQIPNPRDLAPPTVFVPIFSKMLMSAWRSKQLLDGKYRLSATPPQKKAREKRTISNRALQPG